MKRRQGLHETMNRPGLMAWLRSDGKTLAGPNMEVERVLQIPGIDHPTNGENWWLLPPGCEGHASWVLGLHVSYKVKSAAEWMAQFYP